MYPQFETDKILVKCHPSPRQLAVEQMEFYAFAHFTVNTFTDKEWGEGNEPETIFDPTELDADQWVDALKAAGCCWSQNKKLWYWHHEEPGKHWRRGKTTMAEIRSKYGSCTITASGETYDHSKCPVAV